MDAKPQRPRVRVFHDENALPSTQGQKTLHSRHKSQPVLKAGIATAGPQKLGPRKAFGDVSNVIVNRARDESGVKGTSTLEKEQPSDKIWIRPMIGDTWTKQAEQCRPVASRAVLKSTSTIKVAEPAAPFVNKASSELVEPKPNRAVRKSRTTLFQEKRVAPLRSIDLQQDLELPRIQPVTILQRDSYVAPTEDVANIKAPLQEPSIRLVEDTEGVSLQTVHEENTSPLYETPLYEELSVLPEPPKTSLLPLELESYEPAAEYLPETVCQIEAPVPSVLKEIEIPARRVEELEGAPLSANTIPEPEEYWDEEEDDGYAEDGYVTARSFKSIGDNLTGTTTRTLYPRVDQGVKREIAAAKAFVEANINPADVEDESWDTSMVAEYGDEIFTYKRELEQRMSPNPHYMDKQTEIQWSMRAVLMDWIVQVHHRFGLLPETLYLTVNLIDRFLSQKVVSLTKLQLVGATAIFVAAKYEEVDCPSIQEVQFMVDNGYKIEEILKAERFMLSMLGFELGFPGPMSFLRRISKADDYDLETRTLAKYFLEITIMDERFLPCVPSFAAAGAHCLARMMLRKGNWSPAHVHYAEYTYSQLQPLVQLILECCEDPMTHHAAIYEKYLDKRYKKAASYVQTELQSGFRVPEENISPSTSLWPTQPTDWDPAEIEATEARYNEIEAAHWAQG